MEIKLEHIEPKDIERQSMALIQAELEHRHIHLDPMEAPIIRRCIHTSADFDYAENLQFSDHAVEKMRAALAAGALVVTDTEMARAGIRKQALSALGGDTRCFMADPKVAIEAKKRGVTRAVISMEHAARIQDRPLLFAIGNAPTALIELYRLIHDHGLHPAGIIGVPVGFVNVVEAKELILSLAEETAPISEIPWIVARGRKGGSNIAACIVNALLYGIHE